MSFDVSKLEPSELSKLCGWNAELAKTARVECAHLFSKLPVMKAPDKVGPPIWTFAKQLNGGQHIKNIPQEIGDCVSWGAAHTIDYLMAYQIAALRLEQKFRLVYPPYIYATSRVDVGRGQMGRGDGSTGAWAAEAMQKYGILFEDDKGVPAYSGSVASDWGYRGAPAEMKKLASDNPVKQTSPLSSTDEIRAALLNYRPCTYAISWDYSDQAVEKNGFRVLKKSRYVGGHQVCLLWWIDTPFEAAYLYNSWGIKFAQGPAPLDEPPGGGWVLVSDLEKDMRGGDAEIYACSCFDGDPGDPWYGLFGAAS